MATTSPAAPSSPFDQSGFERVHILQGGFTEWTGETTNVATVPTPSTFQLTNPGIQIVTADYVLQNINAPGVFILDSRDAESFAQGHIPGSFNVPIGLTYDARRSSVSTSWWRR